MTAPCGTPQQLIEGSQGLVRSLASRIHRKLPRHIELDDLIAYGQIGLAEAARDFDPGRGTQFSTYAYYRIRGAIYDGLAKMTWGNRSQHSQVRYQQLANEVMRLEGEQPEGLPNKGAAEDVRWFGDVSRALAVVYLTTHQEEEAAIGPSGAEDRSTPTPPAVAIGREISQRLHQLIDALPSEAGALIRATYFEGLTLQEAGQRLGVSKSWASRLHANTLQRLARSLRLLGVAS